MARKYEPRKVARNKVATSAMIASLSAEGYEAESAPFGHALNALAAKDERIVGLSAELSKRTDLHVFANARPERFHQMGMAEQVPVSAAAGLVREGFSPFDAAYAVFASRRAYDFIAMTMRALDPAAAPEGEGRSVDVLRVPTIKPLDARTFLTEAARPGRMVVAAENRAMAGGLGEAAAGLPMREGGVRASA